MADAPVVYTSSAERLIRALGARLDERAHQRFAELGIPLRGKLQPAYPRDVWLKAGQLASQLLSPHLLATDALVVLPQTESCEPAVSETMEQKMRPMSE